MATISSESFGWSGNIADYGTYSALTNNLVGSSIATGGPLGDNFLNNNRTGGNPPYAVYKMLPSQPATFFCGMRFQPNDQNQCIVFSDTGAPTSGYQTGYPQFFVGFDTTTGTIRAYRGSVGGSPNAAVLLGQSSPGAFPNGWFFAEVSGTISATVGTVTVRANGATVLTLTGQNTYSSSGQAGASATIGAVGWSGNAGNSGPNCYVQHFYCNDNSGVAPNNGFLGDCRVQYLTATANGTVAFAPVGKAANWENASTIPPAPTVDYNQDATLNAQDEFAIQAPSPSLSTIYAVNVKGIYGILTAGTRSMANVVTSSTTTSVGSNLALGTSPEQLATPFDTDPATGAQWTVAAVTACTPGYRITV